VESPVIVCRAKLTIAKIYALNALQSNAQDRHHQTPHPKYHENRAKSVQS